MSPSAACKKRLHNQFPALVWLLILFCAISQARAQYHFDAWTADNGLPQNIVRGVGQTPDGYLWIATLDGVARFDRVHFTLFNKSNTPGILSNRFSGMVGGRNGDLWLATEDGRITRYHDGYFQTLGVEQGLLENTAHGLTEDESGHVWVLLNDAIVQWDKAAGRFTNFTQQRLRTQYQPFRWESAGFWGWDETGLHCFVKGRFIDYPLPSWLPGRSIWTAALEASGTLWLETIDGKHIRITPGKEAVQAGEDVTIPYVDHHGHVWAMRVGHQLTRSMDAMSSGSAAPLPFSQLYEDREDSLWLGTEGQGLYRLQRQSIHVYSKEQGLVGRNVYPVYQDRSGAVWTGVWGGGLSRFDAGKFTNYTVADGLPNGLVTALYEDS